VANVPAPAFPPDLADVVKAWPDLPADVRRLIAGVVKLTLKAGGVESDKAGRR